MDIPGFNMNLNGGVAQLGEHLPCKQGVMSSNLTISTKQRARGPSNFGNRHESLLSMTIHEITRRHGDCRDEAEREAVCESE